MNQECIDCGYYIENSCIHPHAEHCKHCELWTPKWYTDKYEIDFSINIQVFKDNFRNKVCVECSESCDKSASSLFQCSKFEAVILNLPK